MKRSIGIATLVIVVCISFGLAFGDSRRKRSDARAVQTKHSTTTKGVAVSNRMAEAMKRFDDLTRYRGTEIGPHLDVSGETEKLYRQIGELFARQDPSPPPARLAHFRWLDRPDIRINGWYGTIMDMARDGDRLLIKIRVSPHLAMEAAPITSTTAHYIEIYELRAGILRFLGGEEPKSSLSILMTD